jgi:hypothetical protein
MTFDEIRSILQAQGFGLDPEAPTLSSADLTAYSVTLRDTTYARVSWSAIKPWNDNPLSPCRAFIDPYQRASLSATCDTTEGFTPSVLADFIQTFRLAKMAFREFLDRIPASTLIIPALTSAALHRLFQDLGFRCTSAGADRYLLLSHPDLLGDYDFLAICLRERRLVLLYRAAANAIPSESYAHQWNGCPPFHSRAILTLSAGGWWLKARRHFGDAEIETLSVESFILHHLQAAVKYSLPIVYAERQARWMALANEALFQSTFGKDLLEKANTKARYERSRKILERCRAHAIKHGIDIELFTPEDFVAAASFLSPHIDIDAVVQYMTRIEVDVDPECPVWRSWQDAMAKGISHDMDLGDYMEILSNHFGRLIDARREEHAEHCRWCQDPASRS